MLSKHCYHPALVERSCIDSGAMASAQQHCGPQEWLGDDDDDPGVGDDDDAPPSHELGCELGFGYSEGALVVVQFNILANCLANGSARPPEAARAACLTDAYRAACLADAYQTTWYEVSEWYSCGAPVPMRCFLLLIWYFFV